MTDQKLDVYRELQKHLDKMPIGYPATESGVELRVLKHLFTSEEAKVAAKLNSTPEPLKRIYKRIKKSGMTISELEEKLDKMYSKGVINFGTNKEGNEIVKYYANAALVIGMFEFQLNHLTKEFIEDVNEYFEEAFMDEYNKSGIPQLRTIPIGQSVDYEQKISSYDELRTLIDNIGEPIAVAECICRKGEDLLNNPCKRTEIRESCFSFRRAAEFYIEKGLGRKITKEEALKILEKAEEDGLVIQPANSQRPMNICTCCDCCCHILRNQSRYPEPARLFATNYYAEVDPELCVGCGICEERCNMDAVHVEDNIAQVNKMQCIGCGVCIPTCTSEAIKLYKKDVETLPPKNTFETYMTIMDKKAEKARAQKI